MCGLYGIINSKPDVFRKDIFTVLGIANDKRGGDSCGVFIDGKVEYGIGQNSYFENFFWDSDLINNTKTCQVALGHDRKASIGAITVEKAHPILHKNEKDEVDFAFIHNGTIHNYEALAKEFIPNINCLGLSDSQVLALIIYHKGFDVLSKYMGGTAFVAVDYRNNNVKTYFYKGASLETPYAKEVSVERPFYFTFNHDRLIFSSIASYLCAMVGDNVYEAKSNKVYQYVNGKLYSYKDIDRSQCFQSKVHLYQNYKGYNGNIAEKFDYIQYCYKNNTYLDEQDIPLHGKYRITNYGRILHTGQKPASDFVKVFTIFFFHGIPFRDKFSLNIVNKEYKKSKLSLEDYLARNISFVRYHSMCPQFFENGICYIAVSETGYSPYNGLLYILGKSEKKDYKAGSLQYTSYSSDYNESFKFFKLWTE